MNGWLTLRKTGTLIHVEWAHSHAKLYATNTELRKGPPITIVLTLKRTFGRDPREPVHIMMRKLSLMVSCGN